MHARHFKIVLVLLGALATTADAKNPIYLASDNGLYKSTDGGASWKILTISVSNPLLAGVPEPLALAVDPLNPSKIYFAGISGTGAFALFSSPDAGQTWSGAPTISFSLTGPGDHLAIDLAGKVIYLAGTSNVGAVIYKTTDGGATWTPLKLPGGAPAYHVIADLAASGTVYSSDGSKFFKSTDFGGTWALLSTGFGFPNLAVGQIVLDPWNPSNVYALNFNPGVPCPLTNGGLCGLFKSTDGGVSWTGLTIPAGYVNSLTFGATSGTLYAAGNSPGLGGTLFKSTDGGGTWTPIKNALTFSGGQRPLVRADPTDASALYLINQGNGTGSFYTSTDGGTTFNRPLIPSNPPGCPTSSCNSVNFGDIAIGAPAVGGAAAPFVCSNTAQPLITSIDSASSYGGYPYFASGSWLEIKGNNLADPADPRLTAVSNPGQWTATDFNGANAPTTLDGVSVSINGKAAYVWYLSKGQLNVQAPQDSTTGNVSITVTNCNITSPSFSFARTSLAPGLLAPSNYTAGGTQYMVATFASDGAYVLNTSTGAAFGLNSRPAKPGDVVIAYGIGFGDVTPSALPGVLVQQSNTLANPVTVSFGAANAGLSYSGLAGNFVGLYEFYITVPTGLANGDYQINVTQNGTKVPQTMYLTVHN